MKFPSIVCTIALVLVKSLCFGQKENVVEHEALLKEYLQKSQFEIDTNAQAVVLFERGYASLLGGNYELEYHVERTIKILAADVAKELGVVNIPAGQNTMLIKIKGTTYNIENGKILKQEIEKSDILEEKITDGLAVSKFNLPGVKQGSIIHYSYSFKRPGFIFVPQWNFQGEYPKLFSEYRISIPNYIIYTPLERINTEMKRVQNKSELTTCGNCTFTEVFESDGKNQFWIRKNIPAFRKEPFMSSDDNFIERVKIHVSSLYAGGHTVNIYNDWNDVIKKNFYENKDFGGQVYANNNFLSDKVTELLQGKVTESDKAQAIFAFVRDNFSDKESAYGYRVSANLKDVFNKKEGTQQGINLLLTAMLRKAGLNSEPVALSTRTSEKLNPVFPDPEKINCIVSKVNIDKKDYLLDASIKQMPFGILHPDCYNGYCRVINEKGAAVNLEPDSIKNRTTVMVSLIPDEKNNDQLILKLDKQFGTFSGIGYRNIWRKDSTEIRKMIVKELSGATSIINLKTYSIINLENPDKPLMLHYEAEMDFGKDGKASTIYFDPYFEKFFDKNPFQALNRKYNIEMDYQEDMNYNFHMKLPVGYVLDDYPKSTIYHFNEKELLTLKNIIDYNADANSFSLACKLTRHTTLFALEDYADLKKFYDGVIEEQNKKLIIKKVN